MAQPAKPRGRNPGTPALKSTAQPPAPAAPAVPEKLEDRLVWRRAELIKQRDQLDIGRAALDRSIMEIDALLDPSQYISHQPQQFAPPEGTPQQ